MVLKYRTLAGIEPLPCATKSIDIFERLAYPGVIFNTRTLIDSAGIEPGNESYPSAEDGIKAYRRH